MDTFYENQSTPVADLGVCLHVHASRKFVRSTYKGGLYFATVVRIGVWWWVSLMALSRVISGVLWIKPTSALWFKIWPDPPEHLGPREGPAGPETGPTSDEGREARRYPKCP